MIQETSGLLTTIGSENIHQNGRIKERDPFPGQDQEQEEASGGISDPVTLSAQALALARTVAPAGEAQDAVAGAQQNTATGTRTEPLTEPQFLDIRV
jgi:hypothetical protein